MCRERGRLVFRPLNLRRNKMWVSVCSLCAPFVEDRLNAGALDDPMIASIVRSIVRTPRRGRTSRDEVAED